MTSITAEEVADTFVRGWVSRFGVPVTVTTDQGRQFESNLFTRLMNIGATKRVRTTSYHPQANGMIERFHRQLKAAIMCHNDTWHRALPLVLLGVRSALKEDLKCSSADLVYGEPLRLPGEFLVPSDSQFVECDDFVSKLRRKMADLRVVPASRHGRRSEFVFKELSSSSHVLLRDDTVRKPLQPPYTGPFRVLARDDKTVTIDRAGHPTTVSIDRVKPAHVVALDPSQSPRAPIPQPRPVISPAPGANPATIPCSPARRPTTVTRSGRTVRFRDILNL